MKTISEIIKNYNQHQIHNYYLSGDDIFLEKFFINQIVYRFLNKDGSKILYHFGVDSESSFLNDLKSNSLFDSKKVLVCWEINKLAKSAQSEFVDYLKNNPSKDIAVIIVSPDFRIKNKFITSLSSSITNVDIRTPFPSKMIKWVQFYAKSKNIKISSDLIRYYIEYYGDNLSNVINEIDKHNMYNAGAPLTLSDEYSVSLDGSRNYHYWQFLDNIGKKDLKKSLEIFHSLLINGISHNYIINGLTNLLVNIYSSKNYENVGGKFPILNKILSKNINMYASKFSSDQINILFKDLFDIDIMIKKFQYGINHKIELMILRACNE